MALLLLCPYPPGVRMAHAEDGKLCRVVLDEPDWLKRRLAEFSMEPLLRRHKDRGKDRAGR
eukprot:8344439-Prorocentrum_lima.AAC.1